MAHYLFEFYQEVLMLRKTGFLNPIFPILIYNGDAEWTAPLKFSDLLYHSDIPNEFIPEFRYYKIAINELPKRELVKIRNAMSTIFYIENCSDGEIGKNRKELVSLLSATLKKHGSEIVKAIVDRIYQIQKLPGSLKVIRTINDLTEVSSMLETRTKKWKTLVFERGVADGIEKGIEKGLEKVAEKLLGSGMSISDIRSFARLSAYRIESL